MDSKLLSCFGEKNIIMSYLLLYVTNRQLRGSRLQQSTLLEPTPFLLTLLHLGR